MKKTIYVVASWNKWNKQFDYSLSTWKPDEDSQNVLIAEREVEFETWAESQLRSAMHTALMANRKKVLADAYAEAVELEAIANELLALPSEATSTPDDDEITDADVATAVRSLRLTDVADDIPF